MSANVALENDVTGNAVSPARLTASVHRGATLRPGPGNVTPSRSDGPPGGVLPYLSSIHDPYTCVPSGLPLRPSEQTVSGKSLPAAAVPADAAAARAIGGSLTTLYGTQSPRVKAPCRHVDRLGVEVDATLWSLLGGAASSRRRRQRTRRRRQSWLAKVKSKSSI